MKPNKIYQRKMPRDLFWLAGIEAAAALAVAFAIPFLFERFNTFKRDADAFEQTPASDWFRVSIAATSQAPINKTFEIIVPIDVPSIMTGYGPMPAVISVEEQTGAWDAIGQTRTVRLADGTTAHEEITLCNAPSCFGYTVSAWSGMMKSLARHAKSEWHFSEVTEVQTRITWNYNFTPRSIWATLPLMLIVQLVWRGAMKQALRECVRQAESS